MSVILKSPIQYLKGVGPKRAALFQKIGIQTIEDVLYYFPRRYEDYSNISPIGSLSAGLAACIKAEILFVKYRQSFKRSFAIIELEVCDGTGKIRAVWFNQPYLKNAFKAGDEILLYGKPEIYQERLQMSSPQFEILDEENFSVKGKINPVYSLPEGISQKVFRKAIGYVLDQHLSCVTDCLPFDIRQRRRLLNIALSLRNIHFPVDEQMRLKAFERLAFEEFFIYQIPLILRKIKRRQKKGISFQINEQLWNNFIAFLPYDLTGSQKKVLSEIKADMSSFAPMQRLVQGDVGSGKTIVAAVGALGAVSAGFQAAFMAPTEVLASQHYEKIGSLIMDFNRRFVLPASQHKKIRVALLTGSSTGQSKKETLKKIENGDVDIVIGTHALLSDAVRFKKLGLIVIDEQHKFGVSQRALLFKKAVYPDVLIMTATPIPRTLSMAIFGDLDVSFITELPKGRKKITSLFYEPHQKNEAYQFIRQHLDAKRQAYIVYPLVEESPKLLLASAKKMYQKFSEEIFKDYKIGLIHGRLSKIEQRVVMKKFREGQLDVLIATTILEVGIDVPNASVILIEHAERFGLSQLHQMRGRIGRGDVESFCLFLGEPNTEQAKARLKTIVEHSDGFKIAEEDLKIRGPGEFFGERQHGLTELKIADIVKQMDIFKLARNEAEYLVGNDSSLEKRQNENLRKELYRRFPEFEKFIEVG